MIYRELGNTGMHVSALGFGCMRLPMIERDGNNMVNDELATPLLLRAVELGVNLFDTHWFYCNFDSQRAVGKALRTVRDKVYISSKIRMDLVEKPEDFIKYLEISLEQMGLDYLDFYHFPALSYHSWQERILPMKVIEQAEKAKARGLMKHLSFSFHADPDKMPELIDSGVFSTMMGQYNMVDRRNEDVFAYAKSKGVGTIVMGPVMGGVLSDGGQALVERMESKAESAAEMAMRFVWGLDGVDVVLSGMSNLAQLEENVKYANRAENVSQEERQALIDRVHALKELNDLYCTNCDYCAGCPKNIPIGRIFSRYIQHNTWGFEAARRGGWGRGRPGQTPPGTPDECTDCGHCTNRCPQHIDVPTELRRVWTVLNPKG